MIVLKSKFVVWFIERIKEKSTWLAIFTFMGLFGMQIKPELRDSIIDTILMVAALVAFIWQEHTRDSAVCKTDTTETSAQ